MVSSSRDTERSQASDARMSELAAVHFLLSSPVLFALFRKVMMLWQMIICLLLWYWKRDYQWLFSYRGILLTWLGSVLAFLFCTRIELRCFWWGLLGRPSPTIEKTWLRNWLERERFLTCLTQMSGCAFWICLFLLACECSSCVKHSQNARCWENCIRKDENEWEKAPSVAVLAFQSICQAAWHRTFSVGLSAHGGGSYAETLCKVCFGTRPFGTAICYLNWSILFSS